MKKIVCFILFLTLWVSGPIMYPFLFNESVSIKTNCKKTKRIFLPLSFFESVSADEIEDIYLDSIVYEDWGVIGLDSISFAKIPLETKNISKKYIITCYGHVSFDKKESCKVKKVDIESIWIKNDDGFVLKFEKNKQSYFVKDENITIDFLRKIKNNYLVTMKHTKYKIKMKHDTIGLCIPYYINRW